MAGAFKRFGQEHLQDFEDYLLSHIQNVSGTNLEASMEYSLGAKGKRLRPLLLMAILEAFNMDVKVGYPAAAALEMIHTYSLVHDDLPAMDDDDLRRGRPTNHIQFDEATAILAGDALLTLAFKVIATGGLDAEIKVKLIDLLAKTSGYEGMIGGQKSDIDGEHAKLSLEDIENIHLRKTGALIKMATVSAGLIAEQSENILNLLSSFAKEVGIAYQIRDDVLDVVGTEEELGKGVATDVELGKSTYPALLGLEGAFNALEQRLDCSNQLVLEIKDSAPHFKTEILTDFIQLLALEEYK